MTTEWTYEKFIEYLFTILVMGRPVFGVKLILIDHTIWCPTPSTLLSLNKGEFNCLRSGH